ncbi:MAG: DUF1002 domain-containing protein [Terrisporobacter sp.]|uniref:DUF1002 domain-containing protein n=1 Tax=Terrisporobacter sp. TaxID=1965305 RepID=UPI002FC9B5DE
MNWKKKVGSLLICMTLVAGSILPSFADGARVVTLGVNNTTEQKQKILDYFGVKKEDVVILDVNNKEEREYLGGIATEAQLGTKTYSCAYVEPTNSGSGINVKTANITWVTSSMVASTLSTAGLKDANCVIAAVFPVSGTGALTGVMKAFEDASGEKLDEDKKELASEELITTGDLGDEIGQDKATGVVNDVKIEVIKNGTSDTTQIADIINNVTNNYNITLTDAQIKQITDLMEKIAAQNYDFNSMKQTLNNVSDVVQDNLKEQGESVGSSGIFDSIKGMFSSIGDWFSNLFGGGSKDLGILGETNDSMLGSDAVIDATDKAAENLPTSEEVEGFFQKIINWFTDLFNNDDKSNENSQDNNSNVEENTDKNNDQNSQDTMNNNNEENNSEDVNNNQNTTEEDKNSNSNNSSLDVQTESEEHFDSEPSNQ